MTDEYPPATSNLHDALQSLIDRDVFLDELLAGLSNLTGLSHEELSLPTITAAIQHWKDIAGAAIAEIHRRPPTSPEVTCPKCSRTHRRGYIDGVKTARCLHCGITWDTATLADAPEDGWWTVRTFTETIGVAPKAEITVEEQGANQVRVRVREPGLGKASIVLTNDELVEIKNHLALICARRESR